MVHENEMKMRVIKKTDKEVEVEIEGEDHTLGNLIAKMALKHPNVTMAFYTLEHPLIGKLRIRVVTDGRKNVGEVLNEVLEDIKEKVNELIKVTEEKLK